MSDKNIINRHDTVFEFPCKFPIKIMSDPQKIVMEKIISILEKHIPEKDDITFKTNESKTGKYISLTATFIATSKQQLDGLYQELSDMKGNGIHYIL